MRKARVRQYEGMRSTISGSNRREPLLVVRMSLLTILDSWYWPEVSNRLAGDKKRVGDKDRETSLRRTWCRPEAGVCRTKEERNSSYIYPEPMTPPCHIISNQITSRRKPNHSSHDRTGNTIPFQSTVISTRNVATYSNVRATSCSPPS